MSEAPAREFVHLHLHSQYSLLDGAIRLPDLMKRLPKLGMSTVAVTDHGNMFGTVDFYKTAKKYGIKPIVGVEAYVAEGDRREKTRSAFHLVLLAKNEQGYRNLCKLISKAWLDGFYYHPRIDMASLAEHAGGLIGLSACLGGELAQTFMKKGYEATVEVAKRYRDVFEPGCFFLEVQANGMKEQDEVNAAWRRLGKELDLPLVATNDCHYLDRKDARAHEVLMCVQTGKTLDDPSRMRHEVDAYWLKSPEEMWADLGQDFPDALENTARIAAMCDLEIELGNVYLPDYQVPEGHDIKTFMAHKAREGLEARFLEFESINKEVDRPAYWDRLELEIGIIQSMGFSGYFMIVQDFINWAKDHDIPVGPGRGSGAGSLVAYALRITDLDPIPYGLLFERFLNPERVSMPDFDIDFCMNRRTEVIEYVSRKYGEENVGQIATFGGLKARGVIKDVGRVLGLSFGETDKLSKMVPEVLGVTLDQALEQEPRLKKLYDEEPKIRDLLDIARSLEGLLKSPGMHAAGVVIGQKALWEYCPVFKGQNNERVTQYAKDEVEAAGLVKFDFLGLKTLTVIDDAVKLINRGRNSANRLEISKLPLDDKGVYALISKGDTEGVFQLESSGFQELLKKLKPDCFEDIVAAVALYRPGPLNSGMLDDFIARKHGKQEIRYPHASLEPILKDTYGVIVYQEQVMQIAQVLAGFTLGAADLLRRAMGKKKAEVMAAQRKVFAEGAAKNKVDEKTATEIFDLMEMFAQYGFNKSHSAAYALLTYQTAFLKVHHTVEFMAAVLTNDRDNAEKVAKGIRTARKSGLAVLPPDVNRSTDAFDAVEGKVLFGMGGLKGVGGTAVEAIIEARKADGKFKDLFDFCERVDLRRCNKKTIDALIKSGAFDFSKVPRARMVAGLDTAVERAQQTQKDRDQGQSSLFDLLGGGPAAPKGGFPPEIEALPEWPEPELLANEKASLGFYISGHPLDRFAELIERCATATVEQLPRLENHTAVTLAGIQSSVRVRPFKNGEGRMAIILFEDITGSVEIIAMGDEFDRYEALLTADEPILVRGTVRVEREEDQVKVSVRLGSGWRRKGEDEAEGPLVQSLADVRAARTKGIELEVPVAELTPARIDQLGVVLKEPKHQGPCRTLVRVLTDNACVVTIELPTLVTLSDALTYELERLFAGKATVRTH